MTHLVRAENEWRFDLLDEAFTVVARNRRTLEPLQVALTPSEAAVRDALACPFCEGDAPHPLDRVEGPSGQEVIALPSPTPLGFVEHDPPPLRPFATGGALGAHEVLLATDPALHGKELAEVPAEVLALLLWSFCRRRADLAGDQRLGGVSLCLPPVALSRLPHVHAALLAAPFAAPRFSSVETCPTCREIKDARARGRVVLETEGVIAYVPFAPRANVHVRIASQAHGTGLLAPAHAAEHCGLLADVVHDVVARLTRVAPGARLLARVCPLPLDEGAEGKTGHLLFEVESLFDVDAPLSFGLGVRIVSVPPEDLAERLRGA